MEKLEAEYRHAKTVMSNFADLETRLSQLIESLPENRDSQPIQEELQSIREQLSPFQYADFEQRFRGGPEAVRDQLKKYLPLFQGQQPVLDLGCGRGEFVAQLLEAGIEASGVDLSHSMLREAANAQLPCRHGDILTSLRNIERSSLGGIFSAQVIEHFEADLLRQVVTESFQVLRPGGLLLLETVNPLSLFAYSRIYLLDTTHRSALHPEFMRYLLESSGFSDVDVLYGPLPEGERLTLLPPEAPQSHIHNENIDKQNRLLFGPSIYAIKGTKP
jgi:O-antigen chain-terminating methyltransferase